MKEAVGTNWRFVLGGCLSYSHNFHPTIHAAGIALGQLRDCREMKGSGLVATHQGEM